MSCDSNMQGRRQNRLPTIFSFTIIITEKIEITTCLNKNEKTS